MLLPQPSASPTEVGASTAECVADEPFVELGRWLAGLGIDVPAIHALDEEDRTIWLDDLGDLDLDQWVAAAPEALEARYERAVDLLVRFTARASASAPALVAGRALDRAALRWELDHYREWRLEADLGLTLAAEDRAELDREFDRLADDVAAMPLVTIHRDFQSHNLMVVGGERIVAIDFQDAMQGPLPYDAVALLRDSYVEIPAAPLARLVARVAGGLREQGLLDADGEAAFARSFALQTVQRKLKDAGRFVFIDRVRGNPSFLRYIPRSLAYVGAALAGLDDRAELRALLSRLDPGIAAALPGEP